MARRLQFRRGTTADHSAFVGAPAEVTVDTDTHELVVHDGETSGGFKAGRKPYTTVAALVGSHERGRGLGERWIADSYCYSEAASGDSSGHLTTAGGVKLFRVDDSADVTALGAPDAADPAGRRTFAPALVASLKDRMLRGVKLRDIVGRNYSDRHDAAATLSAFIPELASAGIAIYDPDNLSILCNEPIRIESNLKLLFGPNTTLKRGFSDNSSDTGALLSRSDWSVDTNNFVLHGGVLTTASPSQTGKLMSIFGNDWEIRGTRFLDFFGGQGIVFGGDDNRISDCLFRSPTNAAGTGAVRMVGGKRFCGVGLSAYTGDDLFQFVPITSVENDRYNLSIEDSYYIGCHGVSRSARVLVAAIAGRQNEAAMTCTIRRVGWIGCSGSGGNRTLVVENSEGTGRISRQMDDIVVSDCSLNGSLQNSASSQDVLILSNFDKAIGRVTLSNTCVYGTAREHGLTLQSPGAEIILDNVHVHAQGSAVEIVERGEVTVRGGRFSLIDSGGSAKPHHLINVTKESGATHMLLEGKPIFDSIATEKAAIRLSSSTANLHVSHMEANKAEGATATLAVSHGPGSTIYVGEVLGSVDLPESGGGWVRREQRIGTGPMLQIASGTILLSHSDHVINGAADFGGDENVLNVAFPAWAGNGQVFTLRGSDRARPVSLRAGEGNIVCSDNRRLASSYDVFVGMKVDSLLVEIGFTKTDPV